MKKKVFCFFCTTALVTLLFFSVVWAGGQIECTELEYPDQVIKGQDFVLKIGDLMLTDDYEDIYLKNYIYTMNYAVDRHMDKDGDYFEYGAFAYEDFPIEFRVDTTGMNIGRHHITFDFKGIFTENDYIRSDWDQIYFEVVEGPATPEQNPNTGANTVWFSAASLLLACSALGIFHIRKLEVR